MRNVVTGNIKLRFVRPTSFFPPPSQTAASGQQQVEASASTAAVLGLGTVPAASTNPKRSFSSSSFIKWRKESNKTRLWRFRSQTRDARSVSSTAGASSGSSVLPTLFSYLSWISQVFQFSSLSSEDIEMSNVRRCVISLFFSAVWKFFLSRRLRSLPMHQTPEISPHYFLL
jgi:zinc transporter ZupT